MVFFGLPGRGTEILSKINGVNVTYAFVILRTKLVRQTVRMLENEDQFKMAKFQFHLDQLKFNLTNLAEEG